MLQNMSTQMMSQNAQRAKSNMMDPMAGKMTPPKTQPFGTPPSTPRPVTSSSQNQMGQMSGTPQSFSPMQAQQAKVAAMQRAMRRA
jgi:hypothetical protein